MRHHDLQDVEWHSRAIDDWFTPALALNAAAFLYCALFCQRAHPLSASMSHLQHTVHGACCALCS